MSDAPKRKRPVITVPSDPVVPATVGEYCRSCMFARPSKQHDGQLECHEGPPTAHVISGPPLVQGGAPQGQIMVVFPIVRPDWWCGAWDDGEEIDDTAIATAPASEAQH